MAEFALTIDGTTVDRTRHFEGYPPTYEGHPTKSDYKWLAVSRPGAAEGEDDGWTLDIAGGEAIHRPEYVAPVPRKVGSFTEFMDIFPDTVQVAIDQAAVPGSALSLLLKRAMATNEVDLTSDILLGALDMLVAGSLITAGIKTEILEWDFNA